MKNIWSILCERSSIDSQSNLISLFNCIEEISLDIDKNRLPKSDKIVVPANLQLVTFWSIEDFNKANSVELKIEFVDPKGEILNTTMSTLNSKKGNKRLRGITNIQGIQITDKGRYYYRLSQKINKQFIVISDLPLDVNIAYKILDVNRNN